MAERQLLHRFSEHKHSVRFNAEGGSSNPDNLLNFVYLRRPIPDEAEKVRVTVEFLTSNDEVVKFR